jgi:hypothetical protein
MKTTSCTIYKGQVTDERGPIWSPVSIYEDGGKLYVRTDSYGAPDTDTTSTAKHEYIIDYPDHPNYAPAKYSFDEEPEDEENGIENVEGLITKVFLKDGKIWTWHKGAYLKSLPIQAKSGSETVLNLCDFKPVEIALTDPNGVILAEVNVAYKYGPMVKSGEVITWDVTLPFDFLKSYSTHEQVDEIIHNNILYKR